MSVNLDSATLADDETQACRAPFHRCRCGRDPHNDDPHLCPCGGAWTGPAGEETVLRYPGGLDVNDPDVPHIPEGFNAADFKRAMAIYGDPLLAMACATPLRRTEKGPIVYKGDADT